MLYIILGAVVVLALGGLWLLQRRFPGRIDMRANPGARAVRDRALRDSNSTAMRNPNGRNGIGPGGL